MARRRRRGVHLFTRRKFALTIAAMTTSLEETQVSYEDLADIEKDFEEVEVEISTSSDGTIVRLCLFWLLPSYHQRLMTSHQLDNN